MFFACFLLSLFFFTFTLSDDHSDSRTGATAISVNQAATGHIDCGGDVDYFKIQLVKGRNYRLTLEALDPTSPTFDDHLTLYDSDGDKLTSDDDISGSNKNAQIEYLAASTSTYYIKARGLSNSECGDYVLGVMDYTATCSATCASCVNVNSPSPCNICGTGKTCATCINTATANVNGGACSCGTSETFGTSSCIACPSAATDCIQCSDTNTCTDCSGSLLLYSANSCLPSCPDTHYNNGAGSCLSCTDLNPFCTTCNSTSSCTSCDGSLVALGSFCTDSCPGDTFVKDDVCTSCKTLNNYCATCNSTSSCLSCENSKYALGASCVDSCIPGTYNNAGLCTSCKTLDNLCATCNSTSSCLSCDSSKYALGSSCVDACPDDTFNNAGLCTSCKTLDSLCETCNSTSSCLSCDSSKYALGPSCVDTCPDDTYINTGICTSCKTLNNYCISCNSSITCTGCDNSKYALGSSCVDSCPTGTYNDNGVCTSCMTLDNVCETCNSSLSCLSCGDSKYALGPSCVDICPDDTYINTGICTSCKTLDPLCETCNSSLTCTSCSSAKFALAASCVDSCPLGTYDNVGVCTSCLTLDDSCQYCNSTTHCTQCTGILVALGPACIDECPIGTYDYVGVCTSCATLDDYCVTCNSSITCLSCSGGLFALGQFCVDPCPVGTYDNNGLCTSCYTLDDNCLECSNNNFCSFCDHDKLISGPNCVNSCPSGTKNNEGICTNTAYKITLAYTSSVTSYLIQFPSALVYDINDVPSLSNVTLEGVDASNYNYTITRQSQSVYQIDIITTQSIPSTTLKLRYTLSGSPPTNNTLYGRWIATIATRYIGYLSDSDKAIVDGVTTAVSGAITGATAGAGSVAIFGGNPALLWPLLSLFQTFYYLIFIDVNYPANVQMFLKIFSMGSLSFIPNPLDWFVKDIDEYDLPVPGRYNEYEFSGLFLDNAGNELLLLCGVIAIYIISKIAMRWLRKLPTSARMITNKTVGWFEWSGVLQSIIASYTDMAQAIFLQLRVLMYSSKVFVLSSVLAFVSLAFLVVIPILVLFIIRKHDDHPELLCVKYDALVEQYDLKKKAGRYFVPIWLIKRMVMCLSLVFLQGYPYVQINILCILIMISIFHIWVYAPYPTKRENVSNTIMEVLFGCVHAAIYVLIYDDHNPTFTEEKRLQIGWVIMAACGIILLISVGLNIYEQSKDIMKGIRLLKKLMSKSDKKKAGDKKPRKNSGISTLPERYRLNETSNNSLELTRTQIDVSNTNDSLVNTLVIPNSPVPLAPRRISRVRRIKREHLAQRIRELREINS